MAKRSQRAPWKRGNPKKRKGRSSTHLSGADKAKAKRRAKKAGRPYPNLVDNMRVAAQKKKRNRTGKKRTAKKKKARR